MRTNPEYERYIRSAAWKKKADERLELDHHRCCVCGGEATEVHHLTYEHFRNEPMGDLVSLCRQCHRKAEEIYDPAVTPYALTDKAMPEENGFMAAMRVDAVKVAEIAWEYIKQARGAGFEDLMSLRQPPDKDGRRYWEVLKLAADALCRKRYSLTCAGDRTDILINAITNRVRSVCLAQIEHSLRNKVQAELHETVNGHYAILEKWKDVAKDLGISDSVAGKLRSDAGVSWGPTIREAVLYCCGLDAAAGIRPMDGFECLTDRDYEELNRMADYVRREEHI